MSELILSLDVGTSSTRASLYDAETMMLVPDGFHALTHHPSLTPDGGASLDPEGLVGEAVACLAAVLPHTRGNTIRAVGISTFWHSTIGVDEAGKAQTPVLLWSDRRAGKQVARLKEELDGAAYTDRTGCPLHTSYLPARLMYLRDTQADVWKRCHRFLSPSSYLLMRLSGDLEVCCSPSMASGTGIYDVRHNDWDAETLRIVGLDAAQLGSVGNTPAQGLTDEWTTQIAPLRNIPFFPALGDGACSNIGCGATTPGRVALMVGTSGALRAAVAGDNAPEVPPGLWRYLIEPGQFLLGGALSNGGSVWAWLKRTLPLPSDDEAERQIEAVTPDSHGLTVLPFLAGERAPLWRDDLRGLIQGVSEATTPIHIARAYLEAVALRFASVRDALRPVTGTGQLIGTGAGLLASRVWAQIICDALGEPILLSAEEQASSRGAALWAREKSGGRNRGEAPPTPVTEMLHPDANRTQVYARARERQERLLNKILEWEDGERSG